jgi:hypothetical protein
VINVSKSFFTGIGGGNTGSISRCIEARSSYAVFDPRAGRGPAFRIAFD